MPMTRSFSMFRRCPPWLALGLLWFSVLTAPAAFAQEPAPSPSAKLVRRGVELRLRGRDKRALALFERAHALDGSAVALAQMGEAEHALGRFSEAHDHLEQALRIDDPWIERHRPELERSLADTSRKMRAGTQTDRTQEGSVDPIAEPALPQISSHEWARLLEAERAASSSADVLARVERNIAELEARWKERRSASNAATDEARASIAALESLLSQCERSLAVMDLPEPVLLSAETTP